MSSIDIFHVKDGSLIDIGGLQAIADTSDRVLQGVMHETFDRVGNFVLFGLEPNGQRPKRKGKVGVIKRIGPPGIMLFPAEEFSVSPGAAVIFDDRGKRHVVYVNDPLFYTLPESSPPATELRTLVLVLDIEPASDEDGEPLAYEVIRPTLRLIPTSEADKPHYLHLAAELPSPKDSVKQVWSTDICRLWVPSHPAIQLTLKLFDDLEEQIWRSDRHGDPWNKGQLGREWQTYQTKATLAISAARYTLSGKPTTTIDRARLLQNLRWQLLRSVENAAIELEKWMRGPETAGVYSIIYAPFPADWDQIF